MFKSSSERFQEFCTSVESNMHNWGQEIDALEQIIKEYKRERDFYKSRVELLGKAQKYMRDPERTIVCDILANNALLPDPKGERYGQDIWEEIKPSYFPKGLEQSLNMEKTDD